MIPSMFRASWVVCAAVVITLAAPAPASAHPPYEHVERVIVDAGGRELRLVLSFSDGIMGFDPVKLVVRGADHRSMAETERGRTISVICARQAACTVFVYGEFSPVPAHIFKLNKGQLEAVDSTTLAILGVVAPLWSDAWGYIVSTGFLLMPWPIFAMLWRTQNVDLSDTSMGDVSIIARQVALVCGFSGIAVYYVSCAWAIFVLAELSPLLTIGSALIVWAVIALSLRHGAAGADAPCRANLQGYPPN